MNEHPRASYRPSPASRPSRGCRGETSAQPGGGSGYTGTPRPIWSPAPSSHRWKLRPKDGRDLLRSPSHCLDPFLSSSEGLGALQRWLGLECPGAEGLQGSDPLGRFLPGCLAGPWGIGGSGDALGPVPFEPLAQPLVAVNDYPAVNMDHKCGSKGRRPWTVPRQRGKLQEASGQAHLPFWWHQTPAVRSPSPSWPSSPQLGLLAQVSTDSKDPESTRTKLLPCSLGARVPSVRGHQGYNGELGGHLPTTEGSTDGPRKMRVL